MHFIRDADQSLPGRVFNRRLNEETLGAPPFAGFTMDLLRDLLERSRVQIDPDVELFRVLRGADWYTKRPSPVPMSMITPSPVWFDEFFEGAFIELSDSAATN